MDGKEYCQLRNMTREQKLMQIMHNRMVNGCYQPSDRMADQSTNDRKVDKTTHICVHLLVLSSDWKDCVPQAVELLSDLTQFQTLCHRAAR